MPVTTVINAEGFVADGDGRHAAGLLGDLVEEAGGAAWIEGAGERYAFGFVFMSDLMFALPDVVGAFERGEQVVVHSVEQGIDETLRIAPATATLTVESHGEEVVRGHVDLRVLAADLAAFARAVRLFASCLQPDDAAACTRLLDDADMRLTALSTPL